VLDLLRELAYLSTSLPPRLFLAPGFPGDGTLVRLNPDFFWFSCP
jgi:hypothetical protein